MTTTTPDLTRSTIATRDLETITAAHEDAALRFAYDPSRAERQWTVLSAEGDTVQVWAIAWPPGSLTGWHDHGSADGAFRVVRGTLREHVWIGYDAATDLTTGRSRHFTDRHIHDVRNESDGWAVSVHAYHPELRSMTRYEIRGEHLMIVGRDEEGSAW